MKATVNSPTKALVIVRSNNSGSKPPIIVRR